MITVVGQKLNNLRERDSPGTLGLKKSKLSDSEKKIYMCNITYVILVKKKSTIIYVIQHMILFLLNYSLLSRSKNGKKKLVAYLRFFMFFLFSFFCFFAFVFVFV